MDSDAVATSVFVAILLVAVLLGHRIRVSRFAYATEGGLALVLGVVSGGVLSLSIRHSGLPPVRKRLIEFDDNIFFSVLLPPIIFYAGYSVKKKLFFQNFLTLSVFGVAGTLVSAFIIAVVAHATLKALGDPHPMHDALALGAVLSATDTVASLQVLSKAREPLLHSLVFGEGVMNDATAIVLLRAVQQQLADGAAEALSLQTALGLLSDFTYLFAASTVLGCGAGLASALLLRRVVPASPGRESLAPQVLVLALTGFLAYSAAQAGQLSAILSVFFCGITMSHYSYHSLSRPAQKLTRSGFRIISSAMETILFIYSGLDMWVSESWSSPGVGGLRGGGEDGRLGSSDSGSLLWAPGAPAAAAAAASASVVEAGVGAEMELAAGLFKHPKQPSAAHVTTVLSAALFLAVVVSRAAVVFPTVFAANSTWRRRVAPIPARHAVVLWLAGLPRGAVTMALAYHEFLRPGGDSSSSRGAPERSRQAIIAATIVVVLATCVCLGAVSGPLVALLLRRGPSESQQQIQQQLLPEERIGDDARTTPLLAQVDHHQRQDRGGTLSTAAVIEAGDALQAERRRSSGRVPTAIAGGNGDCVLLPPTNPALRPSIEGPAQPATAASFSSGLHHSGGSETPGFHQAWRHFDVTVMHPLFGGRTQSASHRGPHPPVGAGRQPSRSPRARPPSESSSGCSDSYYY